MQKLLSDFIQNVGSQLGSEKDLIKRFVLEDTYLNGENFTFKDHEYQEIILNELVDPDVDFVITKCAQTGISELAHRSMLARSRLVPGFTSALVLPSRDQVQEVMKVRVNQIIEDSPKLRNYMDRNVDSSALKKMINGSVIYALSGSATSKSTGITRSISCIIADELARVDMGVVTSMAARQRHQKHKSTLFFSTPIFEGFDISAEIENCGHIWESILICQKCNHEFFPSYYDHVRLPGYKDPIKYLTLKEVVNKDLVIKDAYLECPKCKRSIPFGHPHIKWVNTATSPNLPKRGMRLGAFDLPKYVGPADLIKDMLRMTDRQEFEQQALGIPTSAKDSSLDISKVKFEHQEPGSLNVYGLDVGKICWLTVGTVTSSNLFIHTIMPLMLKDVKEELPKIVGQFNCAAGVVDFGPEKMLSTHFMNTQPNTWVCVYSNPKVPSPQIFTMKVKEDDAIGRIMQISANVTASFDHFATQVEAGTLTYRSSERDQEVREQLSVMRKLKDPDLSLDGQPVYRWMKPERISSAKANDNDHIHHSSIYCMLASRLVYMNQGMSAIPVGIKKLNTELKKKKRS